MHANSESKMKIIWNETSCSTIVKDFLPHFSNFTFITKDYKLNRLISNHKI